MNTVNSLTPIQSHEDSDFEIENPVPGQPEVSDFRARREIQCIIGGCVHTYHITATSLLASANNAHLDSIRDAAWMARDELINLYKEGDFTFGVAVGRVPIRNGARRSTLQLRFDFLVVNTKAITKRDLNRIGESLGRLINQLDVDKVVPSRLKKLTTSTKLLGGGEVESCLNLNFVGSCRCFREETQNAFKDGVDAVDETWRVITKDFVESGDQAPDFRPTSIGRSVQRPNPIRVKR